MGAEKMSVQQWREFQRQRDAMAEQQTRNKYGNIPTEVDGIKFQSHKEAKFYCQCKIRVKAKEIVKFELQKTFPLVVNGVHITDYRCDFVLHYPDGRQEVIDVKSKATAEIQVYKLKKKIMFAILGINIIEK